MGKHRSEDYKISAVRYYKNNSTTMRDTCKIFDCSYQSLARWIERYDNTKEVKRKKTSKSPYKMTDKIEKFIIKEIKKKISITLWEMSKLVKKKFEVKLSNKTIHNVLKKHGISYKKLRAKYYPEKYEGQEKEDLRRFYKELKKYDYRRAISIDETSIYINMTSGHGWAKKGRRAIKKTNIYPFKRFNMICAIKYNKIVGWILYEKLKGGLKKEQVLDFYKKYIKGKYKNHLILLDNAVPHRANIVKKEIQKTNNLLYTLRYHPETNPIEEFFSQLKHYIKKESPQSYTEIKKVVRSILKHKIKKEHLRNYFKHSFRIYK